ncbi:MAG TPA: hypothetical protein ENJ01_00290 [Gammaproteobacteria bacterium]|nr:hypothetical protein [Gammaproteobacteria bacterium]
MTKTNWLAGFLIRLGPMRVALLCMALTVAVLIPLPGTVLGESGFDVFRGIIIPTLAPIMFMVLMLDVLMSAVQKADTQDEVVRARYRMIIRTHLITATIMVLASLPFFINLLAS